MTGPGWRVERRAGPAAALHRPWPAEPDLAGPAVAVCRVTGPRTLVLGSSQPRHGEGDPVGLAVARRPSGGGAVLVWPGGQVWVELWVPRRDRRWDDDALAAAHPVGACWADALGAVGMVAPVRVHRGRLVPSAWSPTVCFAGLGPGEVTVGGRKLVGISQRRTRHGARFQVTVPMFWDGPGTVAALVAAGAIEAGQAPAALAAVGDGVGLRDLVTPRPGTDLLAAAEDAFLAAVDRW